MNKRQSVKAYVFSLPTALNKLVEGIPLGKVEIKYHPVSQVNPTIIKFHNCFLF